MEGTVKIFLVALSLIPFAVVTSKAVAASRTADDTGSEEDKKRARSYMWSALGTLIGTAILLLLSRWYWITRTRAAAPAHMGEGRYLPQDNDVSSADMNASVELEPEGADEGSMDYFEPDEY